MRPTTLTRQVVASRFAPSPFGPDSFLGPVPPEGFTIKANQRSKKYHLPSSASYDRTRSELWFRTTEAAEAAGFTMATH